MIEYYAKLSCDRCGSVYDGNDLASAYSAGWRSYDIQSNVFCLGGISDGCPLVCPNCIDTVKNDVIAKIDAQNQIITNVLGKFNAENNPYAEGTEQNPFVWTASITCIPNAFYLYSDKRYVYMPADAESHITVEWPSADMVLWDTDDTTESETA